MFEHAQKTRVKFFCWSEIVRCGFHFYTFFFWKLWYLGRLTTDIGYDRIGLAFV